MTSSMKTYEEKIEEIKIGVKVLKSQVETLVAVTKAHLYCAEKLTEELTELFQELDKELALDEKRLEELTNGE